MSQVLLWGKTWWGLPGPEMRDDRSDVTSMERWGEMKGKRFRWVERGLGKRVGEVKLAHMEKRGKTFRLLRGSVAIWGGM